MPKNRPDANEMLAALMPKPADSHPDPEAASEPTDASARDVAPGSARRGAADPPAFEDGAVVAPEFDSEFGVAPGDPVWEDESLAEEEFPLERTPSGAGLGGDPDGRDVHATLLDSAAGESAVVFGLRTKMILFLLALLGVLLSVQVIVSALTLRAQLEDEFLARGEAISSALAAEAVGLLAAGDTSTLQDRIGNAVGAEGVAYILAQRPDGSVYAHTFVPVVPDAVAQLDQAQAMGETTDGSGGVQDNTHAVRYYDAESDDLRSVYQITSPVLDGMLGTISVGMDRSVINSGVTQVALLIAGLFAVLGIIALAIGAAFAERIARPIRSLVGITNRVGRGDLSHLADVETQDEIGALATAFNTTITRLRGIVQTEEERDEERRRREQLQANISEFLDVAMDIADGDLTKRGEVSEDVLGNVVDAINLMVEEIADLMRQARDATEAVNAEADSMLATTGDLLESSATQRETAQRARGEVQQVTGSMREMAETATESAGAADRALGASQRGERAVTDTLEGMQNIRREVQGISKRIKALGDRSLEISEIIETISGIASQTNLLALNAAIEAAGAGEAGRRFATVADEVRRLAEESAGATKRVSGLIRSVQSEVQEVVASVEDGTREVEDGYRVAQEAGAQLREIGEIARQSAQFATRISEAAQLQVQNVERVGGRVEQVAGVAEASDERVREGAEAAERLQVLAQQLTTSLARFRVG